MEELKIPNPDQGNTDSTWLKRAYQSISFPSTEYMQPVNNRRDKSIRSKEYRYTSRTEISFSRLQEPINLILEKSYHKMLLGPSLESTALECTHARWLNTLGSPHGRLIRAVPHKIGSTRVVNRTRPPISDSPPFSPRQNGPHPKDLMSQKYKSSNTCRSRSHPSGILRGFLASEQIPLSITRACLLPLHPHHLHVLHTAFA
ncbi:uncharacterized protein LY89DRAFT_216880 [Mollisia scopiformis]|uniref:Uncharacterized protein n=1 Tax=Mollisia scopiformis TaxID=149040 RepID=A0A194WVF8_MOLSC|nr:uncharacterized protein LY89DRAFT_216880 [Mollisia scopiformis]KUJ11946.1 hypothetical protein LY89DRAFT_216880 [Mollisia scopiformis]